MKAAEILGVGTVSFVEPSYADLTNPIFNEILSGLPADQSRLLIDEHDEPLAIAFHDAGSWLAGTFICRKPSVAAIEHFEEVNGEIYQEDRKVWLPAVREYYSNDIAANVTPAVDDLNRDRPAIIEDVIAKTWNRGSGETCLDFCCGSGAGSEVLRRFGYTPLSCDNDPALLSRGLAAGRLLPQETICIDATRASDYLEPVPRAIGVMMGEINTHTQDLWQQLVFQIFSLADKVIITVGTEPEANLVRKWGEEMGRKVAVSDNPKDPIYDRWVCVSGGK
ncbi:MAG: hypothetical protein A4E35_01620 [Methanoregula sp. PtaU1.Bin051]|nr:MAG: hypothetical protein A4E35_01620 [Methanoregula sp. PtaU1.Bin051]